MQQIFSADSEPRRREAGLPAYRQSADPENRFSHHALSLL